MILRVVDWLAQIVALLGVGVILWGVFFNFVRFIGAESRFVAGGKGLHERQSIRRCLGFYLLFGLEFLIGADVIRTISRPTLQEVAVLGGIVLIRTIINFSLNWEASRKGDGGA